CPAGIETHLVDVPLVGRRNDAAMRPRRRTTDGVRLECIQPQSILRPVRFAEPIGKVDHRAGVERRLAMGAAGADEDDGLARLQAADAMDDLDAQQRPALARVIGDLAQGLLGHTGEMLEEGPYVDVIGTYDRVRLQPVLRVESVYVNKDEYTHVILSGGLESSLLIGFPREAAIWESVSRVVPKVYKVRLTPASGGWLHAVISIDKRHEGDGKNAILAAFAAHPSLKHVVVVNSDIDPDDLGQVEWAIATRFQADKDLIIIRNVRGSTLDPSSKDGLTAKMGLDATKPINAGLEFERGRIPGLE
ncbi:MAG: UbiD family decarboxylase, partial [Acidilobaceae archaeon]